MSGFISREGAHAHLELTLAAWDRRLIDGDMLERRLDALADLIDGDDWPSSDDEGPDDGGPGDGGPENPNQRGDRIVEAHGVSGAGTGQSSAELPASASHVAFRLLLHGNPSLQVWKFHKGDADPIPSVPHGHHTAILVRKLDVYTGYTFDKRKRIGRISRGDVTELWNDDEFRQFARAALVHFVNANPKYQFRVANPFRLPRRRRSQR